MSSCNICVENFNMSNRRKIICLYCNFESCVKCAQQYLLTTNSEPMCMNCNKIWNKKFLNTNFNKNFLNKSLKNHRENILFDKEKGLLPFTQILVENQIKTEKLTTEINSIKYKIKELQFQLYELQVEKERLKDANYNGCNSTKTTFTKTCSNNDCRGFLSHNWICGLCNKKTCKNCHELEEDEHKCLDENVETAKLLSKDTKGCPNCGVKIFKIEGCSQMFCTECHTAFNWNTGKIEKGVIHNPHYFEWIRKNGNNNLDRNPLDIHCGREIDYEFIIRFIRLIDTYPSYPYQINDKLIEFCRYINDIRYVIIPKYRVDRIRNNQDIRIKYMRNIIDEDSFKRLLQKREKEMSKNSEICNIFGMFTMCGTDIIYRCYNALTSASNTRTQDIKNQVVVELNTLIDYTNEQFTEISKIYDSKFILINNL